MAVAVAVAMEEVVVAADVATAVVVVAMVVAAATVEAADNAGLRCIKFKCQAVDGDMTSPSKMCMYSCSCSVMKE